MLQTTLTNLRTFSFAFVMVSMLMVGTMAPVHSASAQEASPAERAAMLEQISMLMGLIAQLMSQLQAMQSVESKKEVSSDTESLKESLVLNQLSSQLMAGETIEAFKLSLPRSSSRGWAVRYLNRAQVGVINESNNDKPWEVFDTVSFKLDGLPTKTVDVSKKSMWRKTTWSGSSAYVLDIYDSKEKGYGASFRSTASNITLNISVDKSAASSGNQLWTWFVPENGVQIWTNSNGDESHGGFGLSLLVSPRDAKKLSDKQITEEIINIKNGEASATSDDSDLQNTIDDLMEQVVDSQNPPEKNNFTCNRTNKSYGNGKLACYGMWDYGNAFGGDVNMCKGYNGGTGCEIKAPVCESGKAIAADYYNNRDLRGKSDSALRSIASNLNVSTSLVREEVAGLWSYECVGTKENTQAKTGLEDGNKLSLVNEVDRNDHKKGSSRADVTVITYCNLVGPFCARFHETMSNILEENNNVQWVYRHFPLAQLFPDAPAAAAASECVAEVGGTEAFWKFVDTYVTEEVSISRAVASVDISSSRYDWCMTNNEPNILVEEDGDNAIATGGRGTPWSIIVGPTEKLYAINGAQPQTAVQGMIDQLLDEE